jgi:hypothetical protein
MHLTNEQLEALRRQLSKPQAWLKRLAEIDASNKAGYTNDDTENLEAKADEAMIGQDSGLIEAVSLDKAEGGQAKTVGSSLNAADEAMREHGQEELSELQQDADYTVEDPPSGVFSPTRCLPQF